MLISSTNSDRAGQSQGLAASVHQQPSLFTGIEAALSAPIVRATDPEPSHSAAKAITASGRRETQLKAVLGLVKKYPLSTSLELSEKSGMDRYVLARRLPELAAGHLVSRRPARLCLVGNRLATVWESL